MSVADATLILVALGLVTQSVYYTLRLHYERKKVMKKRQRKPSKG